MEKLTHWKKTRNTNYLGSWDLDQNGEYKPIIVTIKAIRQEQIINPLNNTKEEETVLHFEEKVLPMILNSTNKQAIEKSTGTPYIEQWIGKKIKIGVESVKAFGDVFDALRISKVPVKIETKKCECCGKEIPLEIYNGTKAKCGYGVCSTACRDKMLKADEEANAIAEEMED